MSLKKKTAECFLKSVAELLPQYKTQAARDMCNACTVALGPDHWAHYYCKMQDEDLKITLLMPRLLQLLSRESVLFRFFLNAEEEGLTMADVSALFIDYDPMEKLRYCKRWQRRIKRQILVGKLSSDSSDSD